MYPMFSRVLDDDDILRDVGFPMVNTLVGQFKAS